MIFQKHPVDFCRSSVEVRVRTHMCNVFVHTSAHSQCVRDWREARGNERERKRKAARGNE